MDTEPAEEQGLSIRVQMLAHALTITSRPVNICSQVKQGRSLVLHKSAKTFGQEPGNYMFTAGELALAIAHARVQGHDLSDIE